ncbi:MAG: hypothetical protein ACHREM_22350 [Polyangiales bacterium]
MMAGDTTKNERPSVEDGADTKKERVIHTRVPAGLEQELKRLADHVRVPVSNLVRTILEDAVEMADRAGREVEHELHKAASQVSLKRAEILGRKGPQPTRSALDGVLGFQPLTLAADARCARCGVELEEGDDAHLGIGADASAPRVIVCDDCRPRSRSASNRKKEK